MFRRIAGSLVLAPFLFILSSTPAVADEASIDLGEPGILVLPLPVQWEHEMLPASEGGPPTVRLRAPGDVSFVAFVTPVWSDIAKVSDFGTPHGLFRVVGNLATAVAPTSVEGNLIVQAIDGVRIGYWFSATDKSLVGRTPPPAEYLYMVQGALMVGELMCKFTMLTNDKPSSETEIMFELLRNAAHRIGA